MKLNKKIITGLAVTAAAIATLAIGASANATTPPSDGGIQPDGTIIACVSNGAADLHDWLAPNNGTHTCPSSYTKVQFNIAGAKGATGANGTNGTNGAPGVAGPAGPQGPAGPAGASSVVAVSASTNITNWPETSGWAVDTMLRSVTVTRDHAVTDTSKCGGAGTCWAYTFQLTDASGTFLTVSGKASPNGSKGDHITGAFSGTWHGVANGTFYSSDGTPNAAGFPTSTTKSASPVGTTAWATQAVSDSFGAKLDAYGFSYALTIPAGSGCAATSNQTWNDSITPGDDGQGATDGDITGTTDC